MPKYLSLPCQDMFWSQVYPLQVEMVEDSLDFETVMGHHGDAKGWDTEVNPCVQTLFSAALHDASLPLCSFFNRLII